MWDGYEEQHTSRPYIWVAFVLLLLVMSSIFFLRPSISGLPSGETPSSGNTPVVTSLEQQSAGEPLYLCNGLSGIWVVKDAPEGVYISHTDALGVELWGENLTVGNPLIVSRGSYLMVGSLGGETVVVYHSQNKQLMVREISGQIQAISISETGEAVIAYSKPQDDSLTLKSYLTQITSLNHDKWTVSLPGMEVLKVAQAADGSLIAALGMRLEDAKVKTTVAAFSHQGRAMFSKDIDGRPVDLVVRGDGGALAVAAGQSVFSLDSQGSLKWKYESGADLGRISFAGMSSNLLFTATRRSLLTFGMQGIVGVLAEGGKVLWQYRTRETISHVGTATISTNILIATNRRVNLFSPDGHVRWSLPHFWGDSIVTATVDGRNYVVYSPSQAYLLRGY